MYKMHLSKVDVKWFKALRGEGITPDEEEIQAKIDALHTRFAKALNDGDLTELRQIIIDTEIVCPVSGTRNWTEGRQFNLMFSTEMGSTADGALKIYLRPETAQGIFTNFKRLLANI